jgi:hypothetical protein
MPNQRRQGQQRQLGRQLAILGFLACAPLSLGGCQAWSNRPGARETAEQQAAQEALRQRQLEQTAAAQALLVIKAQSREAGLVAGHQATVHCLRSERAQTDGSELRCEDWSYVQQNYQNPTQPSS